MRDKQTRPVAFPWLRPPGSRLKKGTVVFGPGDLVVVTGGAIIRCRVMRHGYRQATAVYVNGDPVNLRELLGATEPDAAHFVALDGTSYGKVAADQMPGLNGYLIRELAAAEQLVISLGHRLAGARLAHFFCEMAWKSTSGSPEGRTVVPLLFTQELLSSVIGTSVVHVNRTLQDLRRQQLADLTREGIVIHDFERLAVLADFDPSYLTPRPPSDKMN